MRGCWKVGWLVALAALALVVSACGRDEDSGTKSPGIGDDSIKLGGSYPFSGPASSYRVIADGAKAYFAEVNSKGGVEGRKIDFVALDDAYEPPRAVENARRLIEQEKVFALFNTLGTANNLATWDYVNKRKVPQAFVASGAPAWGEDISGHPYTIGLQPDYASEARIYANYLKRERPDAKVAVLYQNDDYGKSLLEPFEETVAGTNIRIVAKKSYESTDPTVASQMRALANSGADTFLDISTPKFSAQAIVAIAKSGWKPLHILNSVSASKAAVLEPAGLDNSKGIVSALYYKYPDDPQWADDPAIKAYKAGLDRSAPGANANDPDYLYGWLAAAAMVEALKGMKEPTREALMDSLRNLGVSLPMLLPGIKLQTGPDDGYPIEEMQIAQFDGDIWSLQGDVIEADEQ